MRPLRLDMEGFGTFAEPTTVDFTSADFFALVGPTGAGKSTVLDAICFALYGRVPRWGTGIEYSLAPSATSGKVRLVFAADGKFYVATRVVKRGAKGKVTTSSAALEQLPANVAAADLSEVNGLIGTALAGSAKALSEQVERIIGLPFDQFTKCVLLPQGAFAEFLHSSAADRRKILENLLGYSVYRDIQAAAGEELKKAEAVAAHIDHELAGLAGVSDDGLERARLRIETLQDLATEVRRSVPQLEELSRTAAEAEAALAVVDEEHALLTYIRIPSDVDSIDHQLGEVTADTQTARTAVAEAEHREERLRIAVAGTDLAAIDRWLTAHARHAELSGKIDTGTRLTDEAEAALDEAKSEQSQQVALVSAAEAALEEARTADLATTLREHLEPGDDCPVCSQPVASPPAPPVQHALAAARKQLTAAKADLTAADARLTKAQKIAVDYRARLDARLEELTELAATLTQAPSPTQLQEQRASAMDRQQELTEATTKVRTARQELRRLEAAMAKAAERQTTEWQKFDHHRDRVARLAPPPADRTDLAGSWRALSGWASQQLAVRKTQRSRHAETMASLESRQRIARNELSARLAEAEVAPPIGSTGGEYIETVNNALNAARAELQRLTQQRDRFVELSAQRAECARQAQVAKQLHQHLGTRQFVNWLLSEALDELVAGASEILHRLTSGQYELVYIDNDFYVVDHNDADLTRPAKTLSGGETFTAALALALAMSEQLAGMSSQGACLEAILLDEGFGTLDAATLDQVAANLESLAGSGQRMVGVVTHVPGLAERIPVRFAVTKDARGSHVAREEA